MITLLERMRLISKLFAQLENNPSRLEKLSAIRKFKEDNPELIRDLEFCLEVLNGQHKINFTLNINDKRDAAAKDYLMSIEIYCVNSLFSMVDHSNNSIADVEYMCTGFGWFLNPLFNREWRLGIGPSILEKSNISPMLAKKYDPDRIPDDDEYYLTEKLDGNRCVARYNVQLSKWEFFSRSGKSLKVDFDMKDLPKEYIFDGEILSIDQIKNPSQENFNTLL